MYEAVLTKKYVNEYKEIVQVYALKKKIKDLIAVNQSTGYWTQTYGNPRC